MTNRGFASITLETATPVQRAILDDATAKFGAIPAAVAKLARVPALLHAFEAGLAAFASTSLTPVEREVVTLVLARDVGCSVCVRIHTHIVSELGHPAIATEVTANALTDRRHAALARFTAAMLSTRGDVDEQSWVEFLEAGYTREQALEILIGFGAYTISMFANRLTNAH